MERSTLLIAAGRDVCNNDGEDMCRNGGVCVKTTDQLTGASQSACTCPAGASGVLCESAGICDLDCQNGSSCRNYIDVTHDNYGASAFVCDCVGPYKGLECEVPFAACPMTWGRDSVAVECLWGGTCVPDEGTGDFKCKCPTGRSGKICEKNLDMEHEGNYNLNGKCLNHGDCANGGLCVLSHDTKHTAALGMQTKISQCLCTMGWGGDTCAQPCLTLACQHGSSCRFAAEDVAHANDATESGAYCACDDGLFKGRECEIAVQKCPGPDGVECLYGGACITEHRFDTDADLYACACPPGRRGARCATLDPQYRGDTELVQTLSVPKEGIDPIVFIISVVSVAFLVVLPATGLIILRSNPRSVEAQKFATEGSEDKGTTHVSTEEASADGRGQFPEDAQVV